MKKKFVSLLLAAALVFSLGVPAFAEGAEALPAEPEAAVAEAEPEMAPEDETNEVVITLGDTVTATTTEQAPAADTKTTAPAADSTKETAADTESTEQKQITYASFRPITIFDVSQTEGEPLPELVTELKKKALNYPLLMNIIKSTSPVPIRFESWEGLAKGYYNRTSDEIVIKDGMSESQTLKTALHETAHSILHADKKNPKDPATKEIEAESVAFIVCNHFGIDTSDYSFAYLASWSSSKELPELRASLKTIQTTAHDLIDRMDEQIQRHMEIQRQPETIGTEIQNTQEIHHSRR